MSLTISIAVISLCAVFLHVRARAKNEVTPGILSACVILMVLGCPMLFGMAGEPVVAAQPAHGRYIDYGPEPGWASALFVVVVLIGGRFLFPERPGRSAFRWRMAFAALSIGFVAMNLANLCSPGWCGRFGFPFPYSWWSDAIVNFNGQNLSAGSSWLAAVADLCILLFGVAGLSVVYRRGHVPPDALPSSAPRK